MMEKLFALLQKWPVRWLAAIGWSLWISNLLIQPEGYLHNMGVPSGPNTPVRELAFTAVHLVTFAIACVLWFWAWLGHASVLASLALAAVITLGIGTLTEYQQTFVSDRYFSWGDFIANYVGALIAAGLIWRQRRAIARWKRRKRKPSEWEWT